MLRFDLMSADTLRWYFDQLCWRAREPMTSAERAAYRAHRQYIAELLARDR
jgi:hypothetical protein